MIATIHRAGLAIAALAVATFIGGALIADGFIHASAQAAAGPAVVAAQDQSTPVAAGTPPPEVVYVRPAPPPAVIHVTQVA
ncbi:MAG TPA: hypothetical protein VIB99_03655, partial [Candidatus Limnocylindrales bacterium]